MTRLRLFVGLWFYSIAGANAALHAARGSPWYVALLISAAISVPGFIALRPFFCFARHSR